MRCGSFRALLVLLCAGACVVPAAAPPPSAEGRAVLSRAVVVWYADYQEVMLGTVDIDPVLNMGFVDLQSRVGGMRCVGSTRVTLVPPEAEFPLDCDGVKGELALQCSDGREMRADWDAEPLCKTGYGKGMDQSGATFRVAYGMSFETASVMAREAAADARRHPRLPAVGAIGTSGQKSGTAFFVTREGYLVTNHHVVQGARRVRVLLDDGDLLDVETVDLDPAHDLAVLKVEAIRPPLPVRRESRLTKGEDVFTLGYPLVNLQGSEQKATFGHVNALTGITGNAQYVQIDVPIQPGNSGGPLLNRRGEVVGVVTSMLNQAATLQVAGVVPQNVNYALKSEYLHELLRFNLGREFSAAAPQARERSFRELVELAEPSVVIVLAE